MNLEVKVDGGGGGALMAGGVLGFAGEGSMKLGTCRG